jgi:hypothetical protein
VPRAARQAAAAVWRSTVGTRRHQGGRDRRAGGRWGGWRSLSPLVLGELCASYLNGDECWWFQAAGDDGDAARRTSTSLGRWRPWRPASKPCRGPGGGGAQSWDVKDFGELRGYAPFSSFLDGDADIGRGRRGGIQGETAGARRRRRPRSGS